VNLEADRVAELADRPLTALTRRDVAIALLAVPASDALTSLPGIRRGMLAAGNPLSAVFWTSAEDVLRLIADGRATVGDVRGWLESTGTEPKGMIGLHVWDEQSERSQLAVEMHTRLVSHLEDKLSAGQIDPDLLAASDPVALRAYVTIQEAWMTSPLADGRVPMDVLLDEKDEEFLAEWDAADADALSALEDLLEAVGDRPVPAAELAASCARLREAVTRPGWPGELLIECGGIDPDDLPEDDYELWLQLAAGVASPVGNDEWDPDDFADDDDELAALDGDSDSDSEGEGGLTETDRTLAALYSIDHFEWLAVTTALAAGGPGTPASSADLAGYVRDYEPPEIIGGQDADFDEAGEDESEADADGEDDDPDDFDELGMESLFLPVTALWQVLGAIDEEDRLTPLGWWGLPEAMRVVWSPDEDED
jgi:hypothetical protein